MSDTRASVFLVSCTFGTILCFEILASHTCSTNKKHLFQDYPQTFLPIHLDDRGSLESHVAEIRCLFDGGKCVEVRFIEPSIAVEWVDGKVSDTERRQILEEVRALARVYAIIFQPALDDDARVANMWPLHGYAQPRVATSPAARSDEDVTLVRTGELPVDLFNLIGY